MLSSVTTSVCSCDSTCRASVATRSYESSTTSAFGSVPGPLPPGPSEFLSLSGIVEVISLRLGFMPSPKSTVTAESGSSGYASAIIAIVIIASLSFSFTRVSLTRSSVSSGAGCERVILLKAERFTAFFRYASILLDWRVVPYRRRFNWVRCRVLSPSIVECASSVSFFDIGCLVLRPLEAKLE